MKIRLSVAALALLGLVVGMLAFVQPAQAAAGFTVSGGRLLDANGTPFIMRGVSHAHTWFPSQTTGSLAGIKSLGANSVRIVLSSGDRWTQNSASDVATVISQCKANRLICILEVHDTTGFGEQSGAVTLNRAVDYWISIQSALTGQERYVIVNIGNEPYGNQNYASWSTDSANAIRRLRSAGFEHTIMVDAPNWGQDWSFTMRDSASTVFNADPAKNTVFSIHMYGVFDTAAEITDYLGRFRSAGLPIVVGEFGFNHSDGNPDEDTIMSYSQANGIGYLGWSWSGNSSDVAYLDMVNNFSASSLTSWGTRIFNGANGIKATAREATVFGTGGGGDTTPPSTPGTPTSSGVTGTSVNLSWTASTDNVGVAGYTVVRVQGSTETTVASPTSNSSAVTGLTASTAYTFAVYARDAAGNRSTRSATVNVTTGSGGGPTTPPPGGSGTCAVTYTTNAWNTGLTAAITIANTGSSAINGWTLGFTLPAGQAITSSWNATFSPTSGAVSARNASYNGTIGANGSVGVGFQATHTGNTAKPMAFTLNGANCTVS